MRLYNTLTRNIEEITPLHPPEVTVYTCGPTVYDYPHIGNWFTYIREDILIRTLKASGLQTKWVMNITDVGHLVSDADEGEDKLEKGARREGKTAWDIAKFYTDYFEHSLERLNISHPDYLPRATDHITEQIELIQKLEQKNFTYKISDGIYFDTSKFHTYADFARLDLDEQEAGKRVNFNPEKRNIADFALWKFGPTDHQRDMEWDSPWGKGFPGWHIECSAMSMKYLGETLDIHAGGIDHVPVHHTNEIAQSEGATGTQFVRHWMHTNHITIEGEKIAKSAGNGITLEDIESKGISLDAFRLHVLESHYRSQSKFSWESLQAAQNRLTRWRQIGDLRWQAAQPDRFLKELPKNEAEFDRLEAEHSYTRASQQAVEAFTNALQDDLDTPHALAAIEALFGSIEQDGMTSFHLPGFVKLLQAIAQVFGIGLLGNDISADQNALITEREEARAHKDWAQSDVLRNKLAHEGIGLRDTPRGAVWYHI
jgi:cysteinyl-tRNA synthetase